MTRYLLNSPILTDWGRYRFDGPLDLDAARRFVAEPYQSAVGHQGTAELLAQLLGVPVLHERRAIHMAPGDTALVFRLLDRPPEGAVYDAATLGQLRWSFGLLTREA